MKIKPESLKQMAALIFGGVAMAAYLTTVLLPSHKNEVQTVSAPASQAVAQVYLLDEESTLIPFTLPIPENLDVTGKITEVLRLMTLGNEPIQGVSGLLPKEAALEKCEVADGRASLYFGTGFASYNPKNEMRILEGLTWAVTQFAEVQEVLLYSGGEALTHMPQLSTPIPMPLNRQIGINNFENMVNRLHQSQSLTVFYAKASANGSFYVPITLRISGEPTLQEQLNIILGDLGVTRPLEQPLAYSGLKVLDCTIEDSLLTLNVSGQILDEEKKVNESLVTSLLLSIGASLDVDQVLLQVDGVTVNLNGVNDDPIDLNSLILNQILL